MTALDRRIAFGVAQAIVDLFQAVDVREKKQGVLAVAAREFELLRGEGEKAPAVMESRQLIRQSQIPQFFLEHVLFQGLMRRASKQLAHQPKEFPRRVRRGKDFRDFAQDSIHLSFVAGKHGGRESFADDF